MKFLNESLNSFKEIRFRLLLGFVDFAQIMVSLPRIFFIFVFPEQNFQKLSTFEKFCLKFFDIPEFFYVHQKNYQLS